MLKNNRRRFLKSTVAAGAGFAFIDPSSVARGNLKIKKKIALGYDNFAVRAMGWKAQELIDYAAKLKCDTLFITDFGPF